MTGIPHHIAIVMDGNRRWSKKRRLSLELGHQKGAETVDTIVRSCIDYGIKVLTLYAFSTENWGRSKAEISAIMALLKKYLMAKQESMKEQGVRLDTIGDLSALPQDIQDLIAEVKEKTASGQNLDLVLALNYGSRDEIIRATRAFAKQCQKSDVNPDDLSEEHFSSLLDTAKWSDPDLFIRPGGEMRMSNFLLWQISYSEVYSTETLWPDFDKHALQDAIDAYQIRKRRFGL